MIATLSTDPCRTYHTHVGSCLHHKRPLLDSVYFAKRPLLDLICFAKRPLLDLICFAKRPLLDSICILSFLSERKE